MNVTRTHLRMRSGLGRMTENVPLVTVGTLAANTKKGRRPSFTSAASPAHGEAIFDAMVDTARSVYEPVACGRFGADIQVHLINNGPVTFILD